MVQAYWSMDTYIVRLYLIIHYHSLFYSLGHSATILTSYCPIMTSYTMVVPEWHFYQTIVQYDNTIVAPWWQSIFCNIDWSIWYFESACTIAEGHVTRNQPISIVYLHLIYSTDIYCTCRCLPAVTVLYECYNTCVFVSHSWMILW